MRTNTCDIRDAIIQVSEQNFSTTADRMRQTTTVLTARKYHAH